MIIEIYYLGGWQDFSLKVRLKSLFLDKVARIGSKRF